MTEEYGPNKVDPTENDTNSGDGEDCNDEVEDRSVFDDHSPTDDHLDDPVDSRNQQEDDLDQTGKTVERTYDTFRFLCHILRPPI